MPWDGDGPAPSLARKRRVPSLDADGTEQFSSALNQHLAHGGVLAYATHQPVGLKAAKLHVLELGNAPPC